MSALTRPVGGKPANPNRNEVLLVQRLLNKHRPAPLHPIAEDGLEGINTSNAIVEFQRRVVRMHMPDGRVDPDGATWKALNSDLLVNRAKSTVMSVTVVFHHQFKTPTGVTGLAGSDIRTTATRYESDVIVSGGLSGNFRASIYPDNMNVKGRLKDGSYDIYLGFHKSGVPTTEDLVARTNGFRAVLVVNANRPVPVTSNATSKQTSDGIHIHNGYNSWGSAHPMSEGCLILAPADWPRFINLFLNAYPNIEDWTSSGGRVGLKIGTVTVMP